VTKRGAGRLRRLTIVNPAALIAAALILSPAPAEAQSGSENAARYQVREEQYYQRLDTLVPDWRQINDDPVFHDWLLMLDPLFRQTRQSALEKAHQNLDGDWVAQFFLLWKSEAKEQRFAALDESLARMKKKVVLPDGSSLGDTITASELTSAELTRLLALRTSKEREFEDSRLQHLKLLDTETSTRMFQVNEELIKIDQRIMVAQMEAAFVRLSVFGDANPLSELMSFYMSGSVRLLSKGEGHYVVFTSGGASQEMNLDELRAWTLRVTGLDHQ